MNTSDKIIINYMNHKNQTYTLAWNYNYKISLEDNQKNLMNVTKHCINNTYSVNKQLKKNLKHNKAAIIKFGDQEINIEKGETLSTFTTWGDPHVILTIDNKEKLIHFDDKQNRVITTEPLEYIFNKREFIKNCHETFIHHEFNVIPDNMRDTFEDLKDYKPISNIDAIDKLRKLVTSGLPWNKIFFNTSTEVDYEINSLLKDDIKEITYASIIEQVTGLKLFGTTEYNNEIEEEYIRKNILEPSTIAQVKHNLITLSKDSTKINQEIAIREFELKKDYLEKEFEVYKKEKAVLSKEHKIKDSDLDKVCKDLEKELKSSINTVKDKIMTLIKQDNSNWTKKILNKIKELPLELESEQEITNETKIKEKVLKKKNTKVVSKVKSKVKKTGAKKVHKEEKVKTPEKDSNESKTNYSVKVKASFKQVISESDKSYFFKINDDTAVWVSKSDVTKVKKPFTKEQLEKIKNGEQIQQENIKGLYDLSINPQHKYPVYKLNKNDKSKATKTGITLSAYLLADTLETYNKELYKRFLLEKEQGKEKEQFKNKELSKIKHQELMIE